MILFNPVKTERFYHVKRQGHISAIVPYSQPENIHGNFLVDEINELLF